MQFISKSNLLVVFIILLFFASCKKENDVILPQETDVIFLGHKGGGSNDYNHKYFENTIGAFQEGLKTLDGVETDIQMSLDGTLWIFHNVDIGDMSCDSNFHNSIILLHDSEIEKIQLCSGSKTDRIYKLSELINLWNTSPQGFPMSIEVKRDFSSQQFSQVGGEKTYLLKLADKLALLLTPLKHINQLFIEVYDRDFCSKLSNLVPGIYICLIHELSFPEMISKALSGGYAGISCYFRQQDISAAEVKRAKDSGLVIQLWTPYSIPELKESLDLNPTTIQTDNLSAKIGLNVN